MSKVAIQKFRDMEAVPRSLFEEMAALTEAVRQRASASFKAAGVSTAQIWMTG